MSDKDENSVGSLLSNILNEPPYNEELEILQAKILKGGIRSRRLALRQSPGFMCRSQEREALIFEEKLVDFALGHRLSFKDIGWRTKAIYFAAREHPKLNPKKRNQGRPKKAGFAGILAPPDADPNERLIQAVVQIFKTLQLENKKPKIVEVCRLLVEKHFDQIGQKIDYGNSNDIMIFESKVRSLQSRISEAGGLKEIKRRLSQ